MSPPALPSTDLTGSNSAAQAQADARRIYVTGSRPDLRVPMREISLQPTRGFDDRLTSNAAVRVYDTSGPWGDPAFHQDPTRGLPPVRQAWIRERNDVEAYAGRALKPIDDGYLSATHAQLAAQQAGFPVSGLRSPKFSPAGRCAPGPAPSHSWPMPGAA